MERKGKNPWEKQTEKCKPASGDFFVARVVFCKQRLAVKMKYLTKLTLNVIIPSVVGRLSPGKGLSAVIELRRLFDSCRSLQLATPSKVDGKMPSG